MGVINAPKDDSIQKQKKRFPQNIITDSPWFISGWLYDTTVKNMLNTLNLIHDRFKDATEIELDTQSIMFDFLDMKEKNLTDDVYVKMNGRGRPLSYFENLKSWMDEQVKFFMSADDQFTKDWQTKMDNEWTDLFWNNRNKNQEHPEEIDDEQLRFFYSILLLYWKRDEKSFLNSIEIENDNDKIKQNFITFLNESEKELSENASIEEIRENTFSILLNAKRMIPLYWIGKTGLFNIKTFQFIKNSIEKLCVIEEALNDDKTKNILSIFDFKQDKTTYLYQIAFNDASYTKTLPLLYALIKTPETYQTKENIYQWIRIWRNLILNTNIEKNRIRNICCTIDTVSGQVEGENLYEVVSNLKWEFGVGFNEEQFNEEIAKAKQICGAIRSDGKTWEEIIIDAEKYAFFKGAIRFLFIDGKGDINWCDFDTKWDNARTYFDECGVKDKENSLLLRKLISLFTNWDDFKAIYYNNESYNWREWILLNKKLSKYVDVLLKNNPYENRNFIEDFHSDFDGIEKKRFQEKLVKTPILEHIINLDPNGFVQANDFYLKIEDGFKSRSTDFVFRIDFLNDIFWNREELFTSQKVAGFKLLNRWNIDFSFQKDYFFRYYRHNNTICLIKELWGDKIHKNEEDNLDDPENSYYFYVEETTDENTFLNNLKNLIKDANDDGKI